MSIEGIPTTFRGFGLEDTRLYGRGTVLVAALAIGFVGASYWQDSQKQFSDVLPFVKEANYIDFDACVKPSDESPAILTCVGDDGAKWGVQQSTGTIMVVSAELYRNLEPGAKPLLDDSAAMAFYNPLVLTPAEPDQSHASLLLAAMNEKNQWRFYPVESKQGLAQIPRSLSIAGIEIDDAKLVFAPTTPKTS